MSVSRFFGLAEPRATNTSLRRDCWTSAGSRMARHCSSPYTLPPANASKAALSNIRPAHFPSQICQRAIGFTATTCIWHSSMSRASVPQASQSVESPSSAVMVVSV